MLSRSLNASCAAFSSAASSPFLLKSTGRSHVATRPAEQPSEVTAKAIIVPSASWRMATPSLFFVCV